MDAPRSQHPSESTIRAFGRGELAAILASRVAEHLEACRDCRGRAVGVASDSSRGRSPGTVAPTDRPDQVGPTDTLSFAPAGVASEPGPAGTLPAGLADHPDYEIRRELGRGGMGVVYLAHNLMMGRDEVLKVIGRDTPERSEVFERFQREIRAVAQLRHPNIVTAYAAFRIRGGLVFAMEYVEGLDLSRLVKARGPLLVAHAAYFVHQAAQGLQHAHERGMVHRDIKPHNLMLTHDGPARVIKVLDFGLAKASPERRVDGGLTGRGQALGTPDYIAPEQIIDAPAVDIRADIYSLGGTLFYLLAGRPPFRCASLYDVYQAHISRLADPLNLIRPAVPAELAKLVAGMMAKDPDHRPQTPGEVALALIPFFESRGKKGEAAASRVKSRLVRDPEPTRPHAATRTAAWPARPTAAPEIMPAGSLPAAGPGRPRWFRPAGLGAAVAGGLLVAWLAVIMVRTEAGVLILENVPDDAQVLVDGRKIRFTRPGATAPVEIYAGVGDHQLAVTKDGFQTFGTRVAFRASGATVVRIRLEPVDRPPPVASLAPAAASQELPARPIATAAPARSTLVGRGFRPLFNGRDLEGWRANPAGPGNWRVQDGVLIGAGGGPSYLATTRSDFKDFRLRLEARFDRGGRSGLFLHCEDDPGLPSDVAIDPKGIEVAINSDRSSARNTGGVFLRDRKGEWFERPVPVAADRWFRMDVLFRDHTLEVVVDGQRTCTLNRMTRHPSGPMALWLDSPAAAIEFRSIEIEEFVPPSPVDPAQLLRLDGHRNRVGVLAFSADGTRLVTGGNSAHVINNPGGSSTYWNDSSVRFWDLATGRNLWTDPGHDPQVRSVAVAPDGTRVASCGGWPGAMYQKVALIEVATGRSLPPLETATAPPKVRAVGVAFAPDGQGLLQLFPNGTVRSWDLPSGRERPVISLEAGQNRGDLFTRLLPTADRRRLITGNASGVVELWDLATGKRLQIFAGHSGAITSLSCSAADRLILSAGADGAARLWEIESGRSVQVLDCREDGLTCVALAPDGRQALTGGHYGPINLWDLASGRVVRRLEGHALGINALAFSPDGFRAASGSEDATARIWDLAAGRPAKKQ